MTKKFQHKGVNKFLPVVDNFGYCFEETLKRAPDTPLDQLHSLCKQCRNETCVRAGRGVTTWTERMREQPEWLLNNPHFSDLSLEEHKRISEIDFSSLKQKVEAISLNTKPHSGWESAEIRPDSTESVPLKASPIRVIQAPKPAEVPKETRVSVPPKKIRNTPMPSQEVLIGGESVPEPTKPVDPWEDADKKVSVGGKVTLK